MSNLSINISCSYKILGTQFKANATRTTLTNTVAGISAGFLLMALIMSASFAQTDVGAQTHTEGSTQTDAEGSAQTDAQSQEKPAKGWELEVAEPSKLEVAEPPKLEIDPNYETASEAELNAAESELVNPTTQTVKNELRVVENEIVKQSVVLDIDPQLRADLDAQFQRLQSSLETEDAFSEALGEDYLSYGLLLTQAGRYDDTREALTDAAHISKINNGLNAIEQRPYLSALFEIHMLQANTEDADKAIQRIIWLEKQNRGSADHTTYDLALRLGNRYLDEFLHRPVVGQESATSLMQADAYFNYVLRRFGGQSINDVKLPYGELALVNFWRSKIAVQGVQAQTNYSGIPQTSNRFRNRGAGGFPGSAPVFGSASGSGQVFIDRAEFYLKRYLARAKAEGTQQMAVKAILNLGDINLMSQRRQLAGQYYALAWTEAQKLAPDDPVIKSFSQPVALPAFEYAVERNRVVRGDQALLVALNFGVDEFGRVNRVQPLAETNKNHPYFSKARRAIRKVVYRPAIREGKLVATNSFSDDVLVQIKDIVQTPDSPESAVPDEGLLESDSQESQEVENTAQESTS